MQNRHRDKWRYFNEQAITTGKYVIPYIEKHCNLCKKTRVLEIGCGEGGNLLPFMNIGCNTTGIDLSKGKIKKGIEFYTDHPNQSNITLIADNIYNRNDLGKFDVIILRDVIEHIPNQKYFMEYIKCFLHTESIIFFGFPPWQNPFGGHQQICSSRILSILPYFHLLPAPIYKGLLKLFGEKPATINGLLEIKETGISIEGFESAFHKSNYKMLNKTLFFINPNYQIKFGLKPRKQAALIASIPWFRNFFTTCSYYLLRAKK